MSVYLCCVSGAACAGLQCYDPTESPVKNWGCVLTGSACNLIIVIGAILLTLKLDQSLFKDGYFSPKLRSLLIKCLKISMLLAIVGIIITAVGSVMARRDGHASLLPTN